MARLQTFPEGLKIDCGRTEIQRMVGNAVPSLVAERLGREIRRQLLDAPINKPLRFLPVKRKTVPAAEKVAPLPAKYRPLIGQHADHPGEGKGISGEI